jgi:hypothetical protein
MPPNGWWARKKFDGDLSREIKKVIHMESKLRR